MGECEIYKEERDVFEEMKIDECGMEKFCTLDSSEKTIAILGDRWWPQTAKQQGDKITKKFPLRETTVIRTHDIHKNLYIKLFSFIIFGPDYYGPP